MRIKGTPLKALISSIILMGGITGILSNSYSLFYSPIASEYGFNNQTMSLITTIKIIAIAITSMSAPYLYSKFGFKKVVFFGVVVAPLAYCLQSRFVSIYHFYLGSIILGIGLGVSYLLPTSLMIQNWYKDKTSFYLGIAMASSGLCAAIASGLFSTLVINHGWRYTSFLYGIITLIIEIPNVLFLVKLKPEGDEKPYTSDSVTQNKTLDGISVGTTLSFILTLYLVLVTSFTANTILQISLFVKQFGLPLMYTSLLSSLSMIANTISKIIVGYLADKIGTFKTMAYTFLLCGISFMLFITSNIPVIIVCTFFAGFSMSMSAMLPSMVARELYPQTYTKVVSVISSFGTIFGAISSSSIGYIADLYNSYIPAFVLTGILCMIGLLPIFMLYKNSLLKHQNGNL